MIKPEQVVKSDNPISNGNSTIFCGQWYPYVVAHIKGISVGAAATITVELQGSMVATTGFITIASEVISVGTGAVVKIVKPTSEWWLYYRLKISTSDGTSYITDAYIGAGGA